MALPGVSEYVRVMCMKRSRSSLRVYTHYFVVSKLGFVKPALLYKIYKDVEVLLIKPEDIAGVCWSQRVKVVCV